MPSRSKKNQAIMKQRLEEAMKPPSSSHPVVSAVLFAHATNTGGGASMNTKTWNIASPGDSAYFVGGEKNTAGKRIKTAYVGRKPKGSTSSPGLSPLDVIQHVTRLRQATGNRETTNIGSWVDSDAPHKGVQIDASGGYGGIEEAMSHAKKRNEKAIWDMKNMSEVSNPDYQEGKRQK